MLVVVLMSLVLFTGPFSLILTSSLIWEFSRKNKPVWVIRRLLVATISPLGISVELMFIFNQLPLAPKLLAIAGFALNAIALKREFLRNRPWPKFIKPSMRDPNGPAGQS